MGKTRNDAANILLAQDWTFEEIEKVLIKKPTIKKKPQSKTASKSKTSVSKKGNK